MVLAGSRIANFVSDHGMGFDSSYRPGSLRGMLQAMASGDPAAEYEPEPMRPEFLDRDLRLKLLDEQGVAKAVVFPRSLALAAEKYLGGDVEALYANINSYNRWYNEAWGFNYEDRLYATALLSLRDLERGIESVEYVIDHGARVVLLLPIGPAYGRSPGDPYFDPTSRRWNSRMASATSGSRAA